MIFRSTLMLLLITAGVACSGGPAKPRATATGAGGPAGAPQGTAVPATQAALRTCAQNLNPLSLQLDNLLQQLPGALNRLTTATPDASAIDDLRGLNARMNTLNTIIQGATCDPATGQLLSLEKQASATYVSALNQMLTGMRSSDASAIRAATQQLTDGQAILQQATGVLNSAK